MSLEVRVGRSRSTLSGLNSSIKKRPSHVLPRSPSIDLNGPGRLRTCHVLALCAISHSTLYNRLKAKEFPAPDGKSGRLIFWNTATMRSYLAQGGA
jgi:predicted DNA-binding transcriptional regulator AlpA